MRNLKVGLFLTVLLAAGRGGPVHGEEAGGASSLDFLLWDSNARAAALGGAYTALSWDANALVYNPAGLGKIRAQEATLMHSQFEGLTHDYLGLAAWRGWGLSLSYLNFGGIPRTTLTRPDGTGTTVGLSDLALGAGYGRSWRESASFGAGVKYVRERIDNRSADAYAFDAGWLYEAPALPGLSLGASLLNLSPDFKFQSVRGTLPLSLRGGAAYAFPAWGLSHTLALDLVKTRSDKPRVGFGMETVTAQNFAFRAGFTTRHDAAIGVTGGIGWLWRNLSMDYAVVPFGDLGIAHRASLTVRWGPGAATASDSKSDAGRPVPREAAAPAEARRLPIPGLKDHFARANRLIKAKNFTKAKAELEAAAALLPPEDHRRALYFERMGFISLQENDLDKARAYYEEGANLATVPAVRNRKLASLLYQGLGSCLMAQQKFSYALRFFQMAHEFNPSTGTRRLISEAEERLKAAETTQE